MLRGVVGLKRAREVVEDSAAKVVSAAEDTRSAIIVVGAVAVVALVLSLVAIVVSVRRSPVA